MEQQFNQPQRQSKIGVIVIFADTLQKYGRAFLPVVFIWFVKSEQWNGMYLSGGIGVGVAVVAIIAYLRYLNFTFYIDEQLDEFVVSEGILNKSKTSIQLHKIQQVNINQSLIQRIIGVYALAIDTAGSDKKEASIKAISHPLAIALKAKLLENEVHELKKVEAVENEIQSKWELPFLKIEFLSLLKIGITSNYVKTVGVLLTFFVTVYDGLNQAGKSEVVNAENVGQLMDDRPIIIVIFTFVLLMFTVVFLVNIVRTVIKFFGYTIANQKGSLVLSYGLINTKSTILKPEKVQIVKLSRNFFQKKLNVLEIKIRQAVGHQDTKNKNSIEIPGCSALEADEILKLLLHEVPAEGEFLRPNIRKLVFSVFLIIILPLSVFYGVGNWVDSKVFDYVSIALFYTCTMLLLLYFSFRNYRLFVNDKFIIKQSGAWDVDREIVQIEKIQALTISQLFWHKRLNIGSLTLHTAGGNVTFRLGEYDKINQLVNLWLYKIETTNSNWM
jgi:putative membrane protein